MTSLASPLSLSTIVGAALASGVILGGGYWFADRSLDRQVEQRLEQAVTTATGANADCAQANAQFFSPNIQFQDCQLDNLEGFASAYLLKVQTVDLESSSLLASTVVLDRLTLNGVDLHLDIKADLSLQNLLNPKAFLPINLGEALASLGRSSPNPPPASAPGDPSPTDPVAPTAAPTPANQPTDPAAATNGTPQFAITQLQIQNITATLQIQAPLLSRSRQFQLDDITLTDVTSENLEQQIFAALQEELSAEVQALLGTEAADLGKQALQLLLPLLQRSLQAYLLGLPF
ncbi:hypothetical protein [Prochlorothrix hollandica]|uniref:Uncharacterized protein n=1 Tax=Prochlorothrix hollandica PCC 9006 = CALU 1027 TaxID=317619 RepID=A0A0M2Q354_PROHO|nr:hypothetical protein [Prochlorothrix hollandica]KKJ01032.1 hypothetical protein PROH_00975 [Prochlorothrix hollandica PCC 9006 = CALU 1027]